MNMFCISGVLCMGESCIELTMISHAYGTGDNEAVGYTSVSGGRCYFVCVWVGNARIGVLYKKNSHYEHSL